MAFKLLVPCLLFTKVASVTAQQGSLQVLSVPVLAAVQVPLPGLAHVALSHKQAESFHEVSMVQAEHQPYIQLALADKHDHALPRSN